MPGLPEIKTIIIDDEISAIQVLEDMVNKIDGVSVTGYALDGGEGLNLILKHRPDIVFLDIKLKNENGFDLLQKLKQYDIEPSIVLFTGYEQFGRDAIKAGVFDYLLKPVDPDELLKVISRYRQKQSKL